MVTNNWDDRIVKVVAGLEQEDYSAIREALLGVWRDADDQEAATEGIRGLCELDHAASSRLLVAASAVAREEGDGRACCASVSDAVAMLGVDRAREVAIAAVVNGLFRSNKILDDYSSGELWRHSLAVAVGNKIIHGMYLRKPTLSAYLAGLLHDVGISLEQQFLYYDGFEQAIAACHSERTLLVEEERRHIGLTHEEVGEVIGTYWDLPAGLVAVLGHHHGGQTEGVEAECLLHVTRVSELMSFVLGYGYSDFSESHLDTLYASTQKIGLDDATVVLLVEQLQKEMARMDYQGWFGSLHVRRIA